MSGFRLTSGARMGELVLLLPPTPKANFLDSGRRRHTHITPASETPTFQPTVLAITDVSMRPLQACAATASLSGSSTTVRPDRGEKYNEKLLDLFCRWSSKFYGQVTFGPRGFAYPSSRWLARRFRMKKHKIIKRFRFRRYKLAAVANLPFAKMIRVGMLPELKSSKTRKGDVVDSGLSAQLVTQARSSTGGKVKGRRSRPKSKYQV